MTSTSFGGPWTIEKLNILRRYLDAYTTALKDQPFTLIYVDAFAGRGTWTPGTGYTLDDYGDAAELQKGSPRIALEIDDKPFDKLVLVEKDPSSVESLWNIEAGFPNRRIEVVYGDANQKIPSFCDALEPLDRAVVFLDPYATQVNWQTIEVIGRTEKIDCWILFPRRAVAHLMPRSKEPSEAFSTQLDRIFGGREHWESLYSKSKQLSLLDNDPGLERAPSEEIASLYQERLKSVFKRVAPTKGTLRYSKGSPMFDLLFAASNPKGAPIAVKIAEHVLRNW